MINDSWIKILGSNKDRIKIDVNKNMIEIPTKKKKLKTKLMQQMRKRLERISRMK